MGDFTAKLTPRWLKRFEDMKENLTLQKAQVCDSRDPSLFTRSAYGIVFIRIILIQISASNAA